MDLRQLSTFRTLAATLSFTRTAETLDYAQSSVTAQIQALEAELGVLLFDRLGRRVLLTAAGERLLPYAEQVLRLVDEAREAIAPDGEPHGTLSVGAPETLCVYRLPPVLMAVRARCPRLHLVFHPMNTAKLRRALVDGQVDVGFFLDAAVPSGPLQAEPLVAEPLLVLAAPAHPLAQRACVGPGDLDGETLVVTEAGCSYRVPFERSLAEARAYPATVMELGSVEAIKQCVMAGLGVTILPAIAVAPELAQGRLAPLNWAGPMSPMFTYLAWHADTRLSPALRVFLDLAREVLIPASKPLPSHYISI